MMEKEEEETKADNEAHYHRNLEKDFVAQDLNPVYFYMISVLCMLPHIQPEVNWVENSEPTAVANIIISLFIFILLTRPKLDEINASEV